MVERDAKRRKFYMAKIREAEEIVAKATNQEIVQALQVIIQGYRRLLGRLPPVTDTEH